MMTWERLASARVIRHEASINVGRDSASAGRSIVLVGPDGSVSRLDGDSAALCEAVLEVFDEGARSREDVLAHVRALAEGPLDERVVDELLALLERAGVIGAPREAPLDKPVSKGLRVVVGISGAVQAMEAPRLIGRLLGRGHAVRVAATREARRFVSLRALEALTHHRVAKGLWGAPDHPAAHIDLAAWAEVMVVYPASATTVARIARGDFSDVVAAAAIATRAPVLVAPSMNEVMIRAPSVARNLAQLREDGFWIIDPSFGVEVEEPPEARPIRPGPTLAPERVVDLVEIVAKSHAPPSDLQRPSEADWDRAYAAGGAELPWEVEVIPTDLRDAITRFPPPRSLLDVGAGLGTVARFAAEEGYRVIAMERSAQAIARARARSKDLPITFVRDDITCPRVAGSFDVAVDRGCLHTMTEDMIPRYAASVADLVRPGGALILVSDGEGASPARKTLRLSPAALEARLPAFRLVSAETSTLAPEEPRSAWLTVWARREG